jgi:hypothetical protein
MNKNPFIFGDYCEGEQFADRQREQQELKVLLRSGQNVLLQSPRRYGKTSLIKKILKDLEKEGVICIYADLYKATTIERLVSILSKAYTLGISRRIKDVAKTIRQYLPSIRPKIILDSERPLEFELDFGLQRRGYEEILEELYKIPQKIAMQRLKNVVVVFDEFQEIANVDSDLIERGLRTEIQAHHNVSYVFVGSKRHLLAQIFTHKGRPLYNSAKIYTLGKIPKEDFCQFIIERFASANMKISRRDALSLLEITDGHPYYTQLLASELYLCSLGEEKVKGTHLKSAQENLIRHNSDAYTNIWEGLTIKQKNVLIGLAESERIRPFAEEFRERFSLGSPSSIQSAIAGLDKKEIIERNGEGFYTISDIFFKEWIRTKMV